MKCIPVIKKSMPIFFGCYCCLSASESLDSWFIKSRETPGFLTIQKAWLRETTNPLSVLLQGLMTTEENAFMFNAALSIIIGLLLIFNYRQLRRGDYFFCLALFFFPLSAGIVSLYSMMRFTAVIFPLFLIVSLFIGKHPVLRAPAFGLVIFSAVPLYGALDHWLVLHYLAKNQPYVSPFVEQAFVQTGQLPSRRIAD